MHDFDAATQEIADEVFELLRELVALDPTPLNGTIKPDEVAALARPMINAAGNDPAAVLELFTSVLAPAVIRADSPRFLAWIPSAPTKASMLFDAVVSLASISGVSWIESAGAVWAVVVTAGSTNAGLGDDLAGIARICDERNLWMHVDAAYGGGALLAPSARGQFAGIERSDSLVIDPHKWLYAPLDCAALLYRDPSLARSVHGQHAAYLDSVNEQTGGWNPGDYAYQLTRRARGLPFWFSLAVHGADAYRDAVEHVLEITRGAAERIRALPHLELLREPELSVVLFRRIG